MSQKKLVLVCCISFLFISGLGAKESYHSLSFDLGSGLPARGLEYGLEYAYRWFPAEFISVSPYLRLNLNALSSMGAWGEHFGNANTWAGENTLAFNFLLLGLPYFIAGLIASLESQFFFCPGAEISYHPLRTQLYDLSVSLGIANNPYRVLYENSDIIPFFLHPVVILKAQAAFTAKAFMARIYGSYEYEALAPYMTEVEINPHGFYCGASISWRFGIKKRASPVI